jgi:hypothetical protein
MDSRGIEILAGRNAKRRWLQRTMYSTAAVVLGCFLFASATAAQSLGGESSFGYGANVTYKNVAPGKVLVTVTRPTADDDADSWATFVRAVYQQNFPAKTWPGGWPVLVGQSELAVAMRAREDSVFSDWVADRRLRPGDILALGGPSSTATADTMLKHFRSAPPNWAKGATLVFMGSPADKDRVIHALRSSGATI